MVFPTMMGAGALASSNLETLARLETLYQARQAEHRNLQTVRDYYNGDHPTRLSTRQQEFLHGRRGMRFAMNYCRLVVEAVAERLRIANVASPDERLAAWLAQFWAAARLDSLAGALHVAAIRDGVAYLMVDYDAEADRPRLTLQLADDGDGGITFHYDADGQPRYAAKRWRSDSGQNAARLRHLNLYYPDRIEKYISTTAAPYWQHQETLAWVNRYGEPLGIPIVAFRNRGDESEIADVIPLQDALNKTLIDLIAVTDTNAFPLLVAQGFELPEDFIISPGSLIQVPPSLDGHTDFKMIAGADAGNLIDVVEHLVLQIARVSSTPLSRFQLSGAVAAEGTLKQQEAGLIAKIERGQMLFGDAWRDALGVAVRVQNTFGAAQFPEDAALKIHWQPAAPRSEREQLEMLLMKAQLGVDTTTLLREAGYGPETD